MTGFAWQDVTCAGCGAEYVCTPVSDYYHPPGQPHPTALNGLCEGCLVTRAGIPRHYVLPYLPPDG